MLRLPRSINEIDPLPPVQGDEWTTRHERELQERMKKVRARDAWSLIGKDLYRNGKGQMAYRPPEPQRGPTVSRDETGTVWYTVCYASSISSVVHYIEL
jgi:hypothetical protein